MAKVEISELSELKQSILSELYLNNELTISELSLLLDKPKTTLYNALSSLKRLGLVRQFDKKLSSTRGRPHVFFALNFRKSFRHTFLSQ